LNKKFHQFKGRLKNIQYYRRIPKQLSDLDFLEFTNGLFKEVREIGVLKLRKRLCDFKLLKGAGLKRGTIQRAFKAELPKLSNFKKTVIRFLDNSKLRIKPF
jgi:hypothetical protein